MKKQSLKSLWLMFVMLCIGIGASAYDFEVDGIFYNILSSRNNTCEVTFKDYYYNSYSGDIEIPSSVMYNSAEYKVTSIGGEAFRDCYSLTSIIIPNSVTSIGNWSFNWCDVLASVTIPNSVTSIGYRAFEYCSALTSITIPNSVTSIGKLAFSECNQITNVVINCKDEEDFAKYLTRDDIVSIFHTSNLSGKKHQICIDGNSQNDVIIPKDVTKIVNYAFKSCSNLTSVTIPNSVTSIGYRAFEECSNITEIHSNIIIPTSCVGDEFYGVNTAICKLYVPIGTKEAYASADVWKDFSDIIEEIVVDPSATIAKPTIKYENGKLSFSSTTEGVEFVYTITSDDIKTSLTDCVDGTVSLTTTYIVTAYAKKDGKTSEAATLSIPLSGLMSAGDVNGDGKIDVTDISSLVNIILNKK